MLIPPSSGNRMLRNRDLRPSDPKRRSRTCGPHATRFYPSTKHRSPNVPVHKAGRWANQKSPSSCPPLLNDAGRTPAGRPPGYFFLPRGFPVATPRNGERRPEPSHQPGVHLTWTLNPGLPQIPRVFPPVNWRGKKPRLSSRGWALAGLPKSRTTTRVEVFGKEYVPTTFSARPSARLQLR